MIILNFKKITILLGPTAEFAAPTDVLLGPTGKFAAPTDVPLVPTGEFAASTVVPLGPTGEFAAPTAVPLGPTGEFAAPTSGTFAEAKLLGNTEAAKVAASDSIYLKRNYFFTASFN